MWPGQIWSKLHIFRIRSIKALEQNSESARHRPLLLAQIFGRSEASFGLRSEDSVGSVNPWSSEPRYCQGRLAGPSWNCSPSGCVTFVTVPHCKGLKYRKGIGYKGRMQPATFVPSFIFILLAVNYACARFYLDHRRAEPAWAETNPTIAQDPAAICARAGVTFQSCFAPLPELGHPGLCLFSAPVTKGSTLSVKLDTLSTDAIVQRLADWERENGAETRRWAACPGLSLVKSSPKLTGGSSHFRHET